jgi:uncharacterized protein (TIGR03435 family)
MLAYDLENYQLSGGSDWSQSVFYDIQAKAGSPSTPREIKSMLRTLLAERFHLKLGQETKTMSGYALVVGKTGSKLPAPRSDVPPESTGVVQLGGGEIWARGVTMTHFASGLHYELDAPVLDETKIEGHYDFKIKFEEGNRELMASGDTGTASGAVGSIFTAVGELGLKLEARKIPVEVRIIQSAERPSGN